MCYLSMHRYTYDLIKFCADYTLNIASVKKCLLEGNVLPYEWRKLNKTLRIPPCDTAEGDCTSAGVKLWLLKTPEASWHQFAIDLYTTELKGVLHEMKTQNLLPVKGRIQ